MTQPNPQRPAIVGVGYTELVRQSSEGLAAIAARAALAAIDDAGLTVADIDGYVSAPAATNASARHVDGVDEVSAGLMVSELGLRPAWAEDLTGFPPAVIERAAQALAAGDCRYLVFVRALYNPVGVRYQATDRPLVSGPEQFMLPYGISMAGGRHSLWLLRYMHDFGATRTELFTVVANARANAALNPHAFWRNRPLELGDYLDSRWIYEPMCIFDCDMPVTGAGAIILTTADRAADRPHRPAYISAIAPNHPADGTLLHSLGIGRADLQSAQLYDGYSHFVWYWLEQAGLVGRGEAHTFVHEGRTALRGEFPVNTSGGSLGEGRLHGFGHLREAAMQVMGRAGERQVPNLQNCLVVAGPGYPGLPAPALLITAR